MSEALLTAVREGWGWTGIDPELVTAVSPFGHLVLRDRAGAFWYLDPEMRLLDKIGGDETEMIAHMNQPEMREIWHAAPLVKAARDRLGEPGEGRCYSLKTLALLKGDYAHDNLCTIPIAELISFTGDFERQTRHLPDGAQVKLKVVD